MNFFPLPRPRISYCIASLFCFGSLSVLPVYAQSDGADGAVVDDGLLDSSMEDLLNMVLVRKRAERLLDVPVAVSTFSEKALKDFDIRSFNDYAGMTSNLSSAYGNGLTAGNPATAWSSSRTVAIRGISGARTTGFYIDDVPIPGSVDVRLFDLKDIEVLKGPQGTLFGESSLGGNIRLITKAPDLRQSEAQASLDVGRTEYGGQNNVAAEFMGNTVLQADTAAIRMLVRSDDAGGFITRNYLSDSHNPLSVRVGVNNQGAQQNLAASVTGLIRPNKDLDISLRLMYQDQHISGFPAGWAPLPAFRPELTMNRLVNLQPTVNDRWILPSLTITYRGEGWELNSSTSSFDRSTRDLEDSTEGTLQLTGAQTQAFAWPALYKDRQIAHETRITFDPMNNLSGTLGVFYSKNKTNYEIPPVYDVLSSPPVMLWYQSDINQQRNVAIFGELYYSLAKDWTATFGDRMYWLAQSDVQTVLGDAGNTTYVADNRSSGHSPKIAVSYQASKSAMIYASATKGFRQGNAQLDASAFASCSSSLTAIGETGASLKKIDPDSLWSYELGGKFNSPDPKLMVSVSLFHIDWTNIQQQILLQSCGLFLQGNVGNAKIDGGEFELSGNLTSSLYLRFGLGTQYGRITEGGLAGQASGARIYQTPRWTSSFGLVYSAPLNDKFKTTLAANVNYTGDSVSANNGFQNLIRAAYSMMNLRGALRWDRSELALSLKNLTNAKPNLGDITYIGYGLYTDANRTTPIPQVATMPPRTLMLQYTQKF